MRWQCGRSITDRAAGQGSYFVAALALLVERFWADRLKEAGVDMSPARAMEALSTVRLVIFRLEGQPSAAGDLGPSRRTRLEGPKLVDQRPPAPPQGEDTGKSKAMQALLIMRRATFRRESQPERRGMAGVCPDAQLVLKLVDHQTPAPPGGGCHDVVTN